MLGAYAAGVKKAVMAGLGMGITMGLVWLIYALSFWYEKVLYLRYFLCYILTHYVPKDM